MMCIDDKVTQARGRKSALVALESTLICHGMPRPQNGKLAVEMERRIEACGAVPATTAVVDGKARVGLDRGTLQRLLDADDVAKCTTRDLPLAITRGGYGATTVAATIFLAARAGIDVMATGGLGGVHQGGEVSMDISADLLELQRRPVAVICAGIKSILDAARSLEMLETLGVPIIGYRCDELPSFYSRSSGLRIPRLDGIEEIAALFQAHRSLGLDTAVVIAQPPPASHALPADEVEDLTRSARDAMEAQGIKGPAQTPFMLHHMAQASEGRTVAVNYQLALANAALAGKIAVALKELRPGGE